MTEDFLELWMAICGHVYDQDFAPSGVRQNGVIYVPERICVSGHAWGVGSDEQDNNIVEAVKLTPFPVEEINFAKLAKPHRTGDNARTLSLIGSCSFSDQPLENIFGIIASFSIDHDRYLMTDDRPMPPLPADTCYDAITGYEFVTPDRSYIRDSFNAVIECLGTMVSCGKLKPVSDAALLGEILSRVASCDSDVLAYLTKSVNEITGVEALAFRKSRYANIVPDRLMKGLEAAEEDDAFDLDEDTDGGDDAGADDAGDDDLDSGNDSDTADEFGGDMLDDDTTDEEVEKDTIKEAKKENIKPKLDPVMMLLELAKSNEKMTAYLYKETVARRIDNIVDNPPENVSPNDILMLKRWRSRWLFLVSTACLRDFISRISIRLSDQ